MDETLNVHREYKHFLRYEQLCELDAEYGFTDLFYDINESTLFVKKFDHRNKSEEEFDFPIQDRNASLESILEGFLTDFMSYARNFAGTPTYENSEMFSKESFDIMLQYSIKLIRERDKLAVLLNADNEIIKYCRSIQLNPEPQGSSPTNWKANCPSGGSHHIMISTKSNEWGCGYCKRKGDLNTLKKWFEDLITLG